MEKGGCLCCGRVTWMRRDEEEELRLGVRVVWKRWVWKRRDGEEFRRFQGEVVWIKWL